MFCLRCNYPLNDLPEPRCPECGRGFDAVDRRTFAPRLAVLRRYLALDLLILLAWFVVGVIVCRIAFRGFTWALPMTLQGIALGAPITFTIDLLVYAFRLVFPFTFNYYPSINLIWNLQSVIGVAAWFGLTLVLRLKLRPGTGRVWYWSFKLPWILVSFTYFCVLSYLWASSSV